MLIYAIFQNQQDSNSLSDMCGQSPNTEHDVDATLGLYCYSHSNLFNIIQH